MTDPKAKLAELRDLFEGCFPRDLAIGMAGLDYDPKVRVMAEAVWDKWQAEFDEAA